MPTIIQYRKKCIGCGICFELQPEYWRMSRKDGKASLLRSIAKNDIHQLAISEDAVSKTLEVIEGCPVRIIRIL